MSLGAQSQALRAGVLAETQQVERLCPVRKWDECTFCPQEGKPQSSEKWGWREEQRGKREQASIQSHENPWCWGVRGLFHVGMLNMWFLNCLLPDGAMCTPFSRPSNFSKGFYPLKHFMWSWFLVKMVEAVWKSRGSMGDSRGCLGLHVHLRRAVISPGRE